MQHEELTYAPTFCGVSLSVTTRMRSAERGAQVQVERRFHNEASVEETDTRRRSGFGDYFTTPGMGMPVAVAPST